MVQFENYKRELAFIFFVQKKKILLTTLLFTVIAVLVSLLYPPIYFAEGALLVKSKKITRDIEALEETQLRPESVGEQDLYSEMAILSSNEVMRRAIESLQEETGASTPSSSPEVNGVDAAVMLDRDFEARVLPDANVIALQLKAGSPAEAETFLAAIMDEYIRYRTELYDPVSMKLYFKKQMDRYREDANLKEAEIRALVESGGVTQASTQISHNLAVRKDLMNSLMNLKSEAVSIKLEVEDLERWLVNPKQVQFFSHIDNEGILAQSARFHELYQEQRDIQQRYLEGSEAAARAEQEVDQAYQALRDEILRYVEDKKTRLRIVEGKVDVLSQQSDELESKNISLRNNQIGIDQLEKDLEIIRASYDVFYQRSQESIAADDSQEVNLNSYVAILSSAVADPEPVFPRAQMLVPLGIITGLIMGLTLGFIFEFFDRTFKRPEEVEDSLGVPVVLSIKGGASV